MKLIKTVPSIEFTDLTAPKKFFVDFLGFEIVHEEDNLCVVQRDTVRFHLGIESDYAIDVKNRKTLPPLFRVETDDIESMWNELKERDPEKKYISNDPKMKPWGAREFGARDANDMVVLFQQWEPGCGNG